MAICFLDDFNDNYIEYSMKIYDQIIETNKVGNEIKLKNIFHELIGVYSACCISKISLTFTKITYP